MRLDLWTHVTNVTKQHFNTLRPRQSGRHFTDDIFKCIFLNENVWTAIEISLKSVPKGPINNIPALVQIMPWRRPGDKPLSEAMVVRLLTHICVARPHCCSEYRFVLSIDPYWYMLCFTGLPEYISISRGYIVSIGKYGFIANPSCSPTQEIYIPSQQQLLND